MDTFSITAKVPAPVEIHALVSIATESTKPYGTYTAHNLKLINVKYNKYKHEIWVMEEVIFVKRVQRRERTRRSLQCRG